MKLILATFILILFQFGDHLVSSAIKKSYSIGDVIEQATNMTEQISTRIDDFIVRKNSARNNEGQISVEQQLFNFRLDVLNAHNIYRQIYSVKPLTLDDKISAAACMLARIASQFSVDELFNITYAKEMNSIRGKNLCTAIIFKKFPNKPITGFSLVHYLFKEGHKRLDCLKRDSRCENSLDFYHKVQPVVQMMRSETNRFGVCKVENETTGGTAVLLYDNGRKNDQFEDAYKNVRKLVPVVKSSPLTLLLPMKTEADLSIHGPLLPTAEQHQREDIPKGNEDRSSELKLFPIHLEEELKNLTSYIEEKDTEIKHIDNNNTNYYSNSRIVSNDLKFNRVTNISSGLIEERNNDKNKSEISFGNYSAQILTDNNRDNFTNSGNDVNRDGIYEKFTEFVKNSNNDNNKNNRNFTSAINSGVILTNDIQSNDDFNRLLRDPEVCRKVMEILTDDDNYWILDERNGTFYKKILSSAAKIYDERTRKIPIGGDDDDNEFVNISLKDAFVFKVSSPYGDDSLNSGKTGTCDRLKIEKIDLKTLKPSEINFLLPMVADREISDSSRKFLPIDGIRGEIKSDVA